MFEKNNHSCSIFILSMQYVYQARHYKQSPLFVFRKRKPPEIRSCAGVVKATISPTLRPVSTSKPALSVRNFTSVKKRKMAPKVLDSDECMLNFADFYILVCDWTIDSMNKWKIGGRCWNATIPFVCLTDLTACVTCRKWEKQRTCWSCSVTSDQMAAFKPWKT